MKRSALILALALCAHAASATADTKAAAARYAEDRNICADETNPGHRMQCLRAAKNEHDKAIAAARAAQKSASYAKGKLACLDCGRVTAVNVGKQDGEGNALGVIAGGAAGALLGNQVGSGSGKSLATIAGAVGGAYAGKKIQEKANATRVWTVQVQYDNGTRRSYSFERDPGLKAGDRVKNTGQSIARF